METLMRIGSFARRFGVPQSTIRYYIQRGILIPEKRNGQHLFPESCISDMERVMEFKKLQFSLDDILELLTLHRKFNLSQKSDVDAYMLLLSQHKEQLQEELAAVMEQEKRLRQMETDTIRKSSSVQ